MSDATDAPLPAAPDGPDLDTLRDEIDELKDQSTEELVSPVPTSLDEAEPTPEPTDPIGSEESGAH